MTIVYMTQQSNKKECCEKQTFLNQSSFLQKNGKCLKKIDENDLYRLHLSQISLNMVK
jgi:hypothetical protein